MTYTLENRQISFDTVVVDGIGKKCILGADFLEHVGVTIDSLKKVITIHETYHPPVTLSEQVSLASQDARVVTICSKVPDGDYLFNSTNEYIKSGMVAMKEGQGRIETYSIDTFGPRLYRKSNIGSLTTAEEVTQPKFVNTVIKGRPVHKISKFDLNMTDIPKTEEHLYVNLLNSYTDIFSIDPDDVGHCHELPQTIRLKDPDKVTCIPPYRTPYHLQSVVQDYVAKLLRSNIIENSKSPFSSPLMLVKKPKAKQDAPLVEQYRIVHDYRRLNDNTVKDSYPMHNLYDLLDKVSQAKIWSVIDLSSGFWNQSLDKNSRKFTAFGVPGMGHFQYTRSAQGLCNSPAAFQRLLDYVTKGIPGVSVYIDDIIIYSNTHEEHRKILSSLFDRLRKYNIKCRLHKIQLGAGKITYLGYDMNRNTGIQAGKLKIQALESWTMPRSVKEIRQFLGLASFFRRTIPNFAAIAHSLTSLTRKNAWKEGELPPEAQEAFKTLKQKLCARPCLRPVDFSLPFILTVDASKSGLGAILSQKGKDGIERPCAYASRVLSDTEKNFAPFHLEHLGMLWACRHFRAYLIGQEFTIRTDHKPLMALNKTQGATLERLLSELEEYLPYKIEYLKGEDMPADGLSRLNQVSSEFKELMENCSLRISDSDKDSVNPSLINVNWRQVEHMQRKDKFVKAIVIAKKFGSLPQNAELAQGVKEILPDAILTNNVLHIKGKVYCPLSLRDTLLRLAHDDPLAGHFGVEKSLQKLNNWYWSNMKQDVEYYVRCCPTCNRTNPAHKQHPQPLSPLQPALHFNDRVHIDLLGPLNENSGYAYVLVCIDAFSKLVSTVPLQNKRKNEVANGFFKSWICRHGVPRSLVSDKGSEFTNEVFLELNKNFNIHHVTTSAYHPQANGQAERQVRSILQYLRKFLDNKSNQWVDLLPTFDFAYNTTVHSSTDKTPFFAAYFRNPILNTTIVNPNSTVYMGPDEFKSSLSHMLDVRAELIRAENEAFQNQKRQFDKRVQQKHFQVGDRVYVTRPKTGTIQQKLQQPFSGPFVVTDVHQHTLVLRDLLRPSRKAQVVHINNVKPAAFLTQLFDYTPSRSSSRPTSLPSPPSMKPTPIFDDDEYPNSIQHPVSAEPQNVTNDDSAEPDAHAQAPHVDSDAETASETASNVGLPSMPAQTPPSPIKQATRAALRRIGKAIPDSIRSSYLPLRRKRRKDDRESSGVALLYQTNHQPIGDRQQPNPRSWAQRTDATATHRRPPLDNHAINHHYCQSPGKTPRM